MNSRYRLAIIKIVILLIVTVVISSAGLISLVFGIKGKIEGDQELERLKPIDAYVVANEETQASVGTDKYREGYVATLEYEVDGIKYTAYNRVVTTDPMEIGAVVELLYDPENPQDYIVSDGANTVYYFLIAFGCALIVAITLFTAILMSSLKRELSESKYACE